MTRADALVVAVVAIGALWLLAAAAGLQVGHTVADGFRVLGVR